MEPQSALTIGQRVAFWRKRRGVSQQVLAGLAGISQSYLSKVENGLAAVDRRSTLVQLAEALQVTVGELTGQRGDPTDPARAAAAVHVPAIRESIIMREAGEREPATEALPHQLDPGDSLVVTVTLDADVAQPGTYTAAVRIGKNTPYQVSPVDVTMNVTPPAT